MSLLHSMHNSLWIRTYVSVSLLSSSFNNPHAPHNHLLSSSRSVIRPAPTPTSSLRSFSQSPGEGAPPAMKDLSDQVVKCEVLYGDHAIFFNQIQDKGKPISDNKRRTDNGYWKAKNGSLQYMHSSRDCVQNQNGL